LAARAFRHGSFLLLRTITHGERALQSRFAIERMIGPDLTKDERMFYVDVCKLKLRCDRVRFLTPSAPWIIFGIVSAQKSVNG
jgi:hypothetical protein